MAPSCCSSGPPIPHADPQCPFHPAPWCPHCSSVLPPPLFSLILGAPHVRCTPASGPLHMPFHHLEWAPQMSLLRRPYWPPCSPVHPLLPALVFSPEGPCYIFDLFPECTAWSCSTRQAFLRLLLAVHLELRTAPGTHWVLNEQILEMYVFSSRNCNPILVYDLYSFSLSITKPQRTYLGYKVYYFPLDVNVLQRN